MASQSRAGSVKMIEIIAAAIVVVVVAALAIPVLLGHGRTHHTSSSSAARVVSMSEESFALQRCLTRASVKEAAQGAREGARLRSMCS
jgi:hypothetical protein